jgi:hypothetical protein
VPPTSRVCGSAAALPFGERAFDLVLCAEGLEHLSVSGFDDVVQERRRMARFCMLVTVPGRESLWLERAPVVIAARSFTLDEDVQPFTIRRMTGGTNSCA